MATGFGFTVYAESEPLRERQVIYGCRESFFYNASGQYLSGKELQKKDIIVEVPQGTEQIKISLNSPGRNISWGDYGTYLISNRAAGNICIRYGCKPAAGSISIGEIREMHMERKISIIVPVYNVAGYLERKYRSIIKQTYKKLEIILVDDGSTDQVRYNM